MIWWLLACTPGPAEALVDPPAPPAPAVMPQPVPVWPAEGAPLRELPLPGEVPQTTFFLVAGHANGRTKHGNIGVHAQVEAEVSLATSEELARRLEGVEGLEVVLGRREGQIVSYGARVRHAERVGADLLIELHTDARGPYYVWADSPDGEVLRTDGADGFSVLFNPRGPLAGERRELARSLARALAEAGFPTIPGYTDHYDNDEVPGVFLDRRGLFMLRRPTMPSVIIETHNAKDFEESLRWREARTHAAFAGAVAEGIRAFRSR